MTYSRRWTVVSLVSGHDADVRELCEREDSEHQPLSCNRFAEGTKIMMNPSLQRQFARVQIENLNRGARDVNRHRTVASTDSLRRRSNAMRLSAPIGRAMNRLFEVGRDTREDAAAIH
jgi:hypothetical protein